MLPFTIYSILGDISLGLSTTEILGPVHSRNGKQQWPDGNSPGYIYPMKITCQYPHTRPISNDDQNSPQPYVIRSKVTIQFGYVAAQCPLKGSTSRDATNLVNAKIALRQKECDCSIDNKADIRHLDNQPIFTGCSYPIGRPPSGHAHRDIHRGIASRRGSV